MNESENLGIPDDDQSPTKRRALNQNIFADDKNFVAPNKSQ